jgi:hypothetical protein
MLAESAPGRPGRFRLWRCALHRTARCSPPCRPRRAPSTSAHAPARHPRNIDAPARAAADDAGVGGLPGRATERLSARGIGRSPPGGAPASSVATTQLAAVSSVCTSTISCAKISIGGWGDSCQKQPLAMGRNVLQDCGSDECEEHPCTLSCKPKEIPDPKRTN